MRIRIQGRSYYGVIHILYSNHGNITTASMIPKSNNLIAFLLFKFVIDPLIKYIQSHQEYDINDTIKPRDFI